MPSFTCLCKKAIWTGQIPCPFEWRFLSSAELSQRPESSDWLDLYLATSIATMCPRCARLHLWYGGVSRPALVNRPAAAGDFDSARRLLPEGIAEAGPWSQFFERELHGAKRAEYDAEPPIARFQCSCGTEIRGEVELSCRRWLFLSDTRFHDWGGDIVDRSSFVDACGVAILCPACKRLHLFPGESPLGPIVYAPEESRDWPTCDTVEGDPARWYAFYG